MLWSIFVTKIHEGPEGWTNFIMKSTDTFPKFRMIRSKRKKGAENPSIEKCIEKP
jgi:hypothetical protein